MGEKRTLFSDDEVENALSPPGLNMAPAAKRSKPAGQQTLLGTFLAKSKSPGDSPVAAIKEEGKAALLTELPDAKSNAASQPGESDFLTQVPQTVTVKVEGRGSADLMAEDFNPAVMPREDFSFYSMSKKEKVYDSKRTLFALLAKVWQLVEDLKFTGSGSKKKATLVMSNYFRVLLFHCPHELPFALFLTLHRVAPDYFGVEIGVGESILVKTLCETYGRSEQQVKTDLYASGDLGSIAQKSKVSMSTLFQPARLSLRSVFDDLSAIAKIKGNNTQMKKRELIKKLLVGAVDNEPKFIIRFLEKSLRIGVKSATVISALAWAVCLTPAASGQVEDDPVVREEILRVGMTSRFIEHFSKVKCTADVRHEASPQTLAKLEARMLEMELAIRDAYSQVANLGYLVYYLLLGCDAEQIKEKIVICPGVPIAPMLAKPTKGLSDVLEAMSGCAFRAEYKYDGERIQIHKLESGDVHLFSRNMEVLDAKYPDVKEVAISSVNEGTVDFIADAEVVAYNREDGAILPFQILAGRKRKDVDVSTLQVQVCLYVFDCLRFNGEVIVKKSLRERQEAMRKALVESEGRLMFAKGGTVEDTQELEALLLEAIDQKTEGLMVKALDGSRSFYEPSKRSVNWLKLKKDYLEDLGDSLDLVPIGAFWGRGRRSGAYGAYLLAVYDRDDEVYRSVCKVATGFTDDDLTTHYAFFKERTLAAKPGYYHLSSSMEADVWLAPEQVWECKAADLSISPVHTAGWNARAPGKGIGLRFPRFLKIRADKTTEMASDSNLIIDMYDEQFKERAKKKVEEDDETVEKLLDDDLL